MATHVCRDFLTWANVSIPNLTLYVTSLFLRRVLNFTVVGQTNCDIDSATMTKGSGVSGAFNVVAGKERYFQVSSGEYTPSVNDVNRILAVRSTSNPMINSGLYRITAFDSVTNSFVINNRSPDNPAVETGMQWSVHEREDLATTGFQNGGNALGTNAYHGWGAATTSRIILQSPHSTAWQVRICQETATDFGIGIGAKTSFSTGLNGNSSGDFLVGGKHTHVALWFNATNAGTVLYDTSGTSAGIYHNSSPLSVRFYIWGDQTLGSTYLAVRQHGSSTSEGNVVFGICEDEDQPTPSDVIYRLFNFGMTNSTPTISLKAGFRNADQEMGTAFGYSGQPISCIPSTYSYMPVQAANNTVYSDTNSSDSSFIGVTELHGFDMIAGTYDTVDLTTSQPYLVLEPRRIGRAPMVRRGRENYQNFSTSTDQARSWLHLYNGVYLPWSGSILP